MRHLQQEHGFSQRRACRTTSCNRKTAQHVSRRPHAVLMMQHDAALRGRLKQLADHKPRWGYKLLWGALRQEDYLVNHKKLSGIASRLYKEEQLELRRKGKKRLKSELRGQPEQPTAPGQLWTMDFGRWTLSVMP